MAGTRIPILIHIQFVCVGALNFSCDTSIMAITQFIYLFSYLFIYNTAAGPDLDMGQVPGGLGCVLFFIFLLLSGECSWR